jgi:hypothetical protein
MANIHWDTYRGTYRGHQVAATSHHGDWRGRVFPTGYRSVDPTTIYSPIQRNRDEARQWCEDNFDPAVFNATVPLTSLEQRLKDRRMAREAQNG